jgi:SAM-dependent methyltransferase
MEPAFQQQVECACGRTYPRLPSGGIDFLQGEEFADFDLDPDDPEQRRMLEGEARGVSWRMEMLVLPLIERYLRASWAGTDAASVLDCGCGNGISVDVLREHGLNAWGIDAGRARHQQWRKRASGHHLHSANALRLPFPGSAFEVVISSGLIEHIGIYEEEGRRYRSSRLPDCDAQRQRFIDELVRVLRPGGFILLDHPNGGFPIDFWHGGRAGSFRWHWTHGDMLPRFSEVRRHFNEANPSLRLFSLSPARRLRFDQVRRHWYGEVFTPLMKLWLLLLDRRAFSLPARSFVNPYLVTIATRQPDAEKWIYP